MMRQLRDSTVCVSPLVQLRRPVTAADYPQINSNYKTLSTYPSR